MRKSIISPALNNKLTTFSAVLFCLIIVLLLHRNVGIEHDARLYLVQGLYKQYYDIFSQDLFFLHGSQNKYTIFPWIVSNILRLLNAEFTFIVGTLIGLLLFSIASWYCLKALLPEGLRYVAWLGIFCLPSMYGGAGVFSYGEAFLTPRVIAEAAFLFSIFLMVRNYQVAAIICLVVAGLFHPLQILTALPVIWVWLVMRQRRWLHALWIIGPLVVLSVIGVSPLDTMFHRLDPLWLMALQNNEHLFLFLWMADDFNKLIFDIFILILAWKWLSSSWSVWCQAALIALILGITNSLILVDWLHLALPTSLQLWRVHWLAHWFAMASFSLLLLKHWKEKQGSRVILLMLTGQLVWTDISNWVWIIAGSLYVAWPSLIIHLRERSIKLLNWLFIVGLFLLFIKHLLFIDNASPLIKDPHLKVINYSALIFPSLALGLTLFGLYLWNHSTQRKRWLLTLSLLPVLFWSGMQWDGRSEMQRIVDAAEDKRDVFGIDIPENAQIQIYPMDNSALLSWQILRRAHYFSFTQVAGQVFNRGTAEEGFYRWLRLKPLEDEISLCPKDRGLKMQYLYCSISNAALYAVCDPSIPDFPAPPNYLVLPFNQPQTALGQWSIHNTKTGEWMITYYLYSCESLMEELQVEMEEKADNVTVGISS